MHIDFLRSRLHVLGITLNFVNRRLYEKLAEVLTISDKVVAVLEGTDQETGKWMSFVITGDRVYVLSTADDNDIDVAVHNRHEVKSLEIDGDVFATVTIKTPQHFYALKRVDMSDALIFKGELE